jgi:hypothetical protein
MTSSYGLLCDHRKRCRGLSISAALMTSSYGLLCDHRKRCRGLSISAALMPSLYGLLCDHRKRCRGLSISAVNMAANTKALGMELIHECCSFYLLWWFDIYIYLLTCCLTLLSMRTHFLLSQVLTLALTFQAKWDAGVVSLTLKELSDMEKDFSKCIHFLASFLANVTKRGTFPHCKFARHRGPACLYSFANNSQ